MAVDSAQEKRWKAEEAARTLIRAQEIKNDKPLFRQAQKELLKQQKAINKAIGKSKKG